MNIAEAKAKLSELVARAEAGEEVIIARDGKPAVVLKPANDARAAKPARQIGFLKHLGPVAINDPEWDKPDPADADFAEQSFEDDHAGPASAKTP